jgi:hypothetical protein
MGKGEKTPIFHSGSKGGGNMHGATDWERAMWFRGQVNKP